MAKIRHNNFMDTVDAVISDAKRKGVVHLYAEGEALTGRKLQIKGKELFHFGTTGYLGLEQDERLKEAAVQAIRRYGTQFPLSKTYISHPLYNGLEERLARMYGQPIIVTKNSSLGHIAVIPSVVSDEDGVILDHQVHWSVQHAAQGLKTRGIAVEMIRHSNLEMLEDKIKELATGCRKIWYMADGVYSMYGDYAPIAELMALSNKYPQLHLYFDDVHGMSWKGKHGTGHVLEQVGELPENVLLFGTLSKSFGASGAVFVCADKKLYTRVKNFGGPLTFSAQLEPASVAAATASADIHLSPEIYSMQQELGAKIRYFNQLLQQTELPLIQQNDSPVFYIGTGSPATGYDFVQRLMEEGFFVNLGLYPAVPVKNTGVRITLSRHNEKEEIRALCEAMDYHYLKAVEGTGGNVWRIRRGFGLKAAGLPMMEPPHKQGELELQHEKRIRDIEVGLWDRLMGSESVFDAAGLEFLEEVFEKGTKAEDQWEFHYFIIKDAIGRPVLATFFTRTLWKDDMLAAEAISREVEARRKLEPRFLTSYVFGMGSLFTEGKQCYIDQGHPQWKAALHLLVKEIESRAEERQCAMTVFRDFDPAEQKISEILHGRGFIKIQMPDGNIIEKIGWANMEGYVAGLSARSRRHFKKEIQAYEEKFEIITTDRMTEEETQTCYGLYLNVKDNNFGLNTFAYPFELFQKMEAHPLWEFILLYLKVGGMAERKLVGVMFCYKNQGITYVPNLIGMDYAYAKAYQIYRQLLYQTIKRATALGFERIDFGLTATFEKRKVGATAKPMVAYVQAKDNFAMEYMATIQKA